MRKLKDWTIESVSLPHSKYFNYEKDKPTYIGEAVIITYKHHGNNTIFFDINDLIDVPPESQRDDIKKKALQYFNKILSKRKIDFEGKFELNVIKVSEPQECTPRGILSCRAPKYQIDVECENGIEFSRKFDNHGKATKFQELMEKKKIVR